MPTSATNAANRPQGSAPHGRLLRASEVAERLGVDPSTVYRLIERGSLPALQLGGKGHTVRIDERELGAWLYDQGDAA
jgi:excisionase family DNA binding protein